MTDLTNKVMNMPVNEMHVLLTKYQSVLEVVKRKNKIHEIAYIIDISYNHIINNHNNLNPDWKTWTIVVVLDLFDNINNDSDIINIIDDFILFYINNYKTYIDDIGLSASIYDRDCGFINLYMFNYKKIKLLHLI
jgi:hypothetical protein